MLIAPTATLNDGHKIPMIALGTWAALGGESERAVKDAIDAGYRHIDTAFLYANEVEVGNAVRAKIDEGVIKREDIFITTKLWNTFHEPSRVEGACRASLRNLGLDYVDLYLLHWPVAFEYIGEKEFWPAHPNGDFKTSDIDFVDTYKAMEKLVKLGLVRSIGVSNLNHEQLTRLLKSATIKPVCNQIELCPNLVQHKLVKFCLERDILVTAYCPLGRPNFEEKTPDFFFDSKMDKICKKYNKSPAQITLRYIVDIGAIPLPKSANKKRLLENIQIFDFKLTEDEVKQLDAFDCQKRLCIFEEMKTNVHYPFNIKYN